MLTELLASEISRPPINEINDRFIFQVKCPAGNYVFSGFIGSGGGAKIIKVSCFLLKRTRLPSTVQPYIFYFDNLKNSDSIPLLRTVLLPQLHSHIFYINIYTYSFKFDLWSQTYFVTLFRRAQVDMTSRFALLFIFRSVRMWHLFLKLRSPYFALLMRNTCYDKTCFVCFTFSCPPQLLASDRYMEKR